jgi:hypothetical protein
VPAPDRREGSVEPLLLALACILGVAFYACAFWARGIRIPVGDDSFFYVSAIRASGRLGLVTSHLAARPAYPPMAATLGSVARSSPWTTAVALPFAMAAGVGAAGAALAGRWGVRRWGLATFALLAAASVIVGRLVAGRSENLLTVWFLAAALAVWVWASGRRRLWGTGLMIFVAGLTEWPFLAAFLAIMGSALAFASMPPFRSRRPELAELTLISVVAAAGVAMVVFVLNGASPGDAVQRLPPRSRYRPFLVETLPTYKPLLIVPAVVAGWVATRRGDATKLGAVRWVLGAWLLLTALVLAAGLAGLALPTYRALTFALPVTLAAAAAPLVPSALAIRVRRSARLMWTSVAVAFALAAFLPGAVVWYRDFRPRTNSEELTQIAAAARYVATLPQGTPVVATYENPDVLKALYYEGVIDAVLPAAFRGRVQLFPGSAEEALAGTPRIAGDPAERQTAGDLFDDVGVALERGAPIIALRAFDLPGFYRGLVTDAPRIGEGAVLVRGPPPTFGSPQPDPFVALPAGWDLLLRAVVMLTVLTLAGVGWSTVLMAGARPAVRLGVAPALGAAAIALLSLVAVRIGVALTGPAGPGIVVAGLIASLAAGEWARRHGPSG